MSPFLTVPREAAASRLTHVDSLRGLAVALVVLFHARVPGFEGGFVGVDVFFVISGYVMMRWAEQHAEANTFPWKTYVVARVRRLMPALLAMLLAALLASMLWQLPGELHYTAKHAGSAAVFLSNFFLVREQGYFAANAWLKPLHHTWSLSVEGQFYVVFPLLVLLCFRLPRRAGRILFGLMCMGWGLSVWWTSYDPSSAYLLTPPRVWQFLLGMWLAVVAVPPPKTPATGNLLTVLGVLAIIASNWLFTSTTPWPGWAALLPCLGAALYIWAAPSALALHRWIAARPVVWLGLISYSLYLWHWPVLTFWQLISNGEGKAWALPAVLLLCLLTSHASWRWIEQPARSIRTLAFNGPMVSLLLGVLLVQGIAAINWITIGLPARFKPAELLTLQYLDDENKWRDTCAVGPREPEVLPSPSCVIGDPAAPRWWVVWGDSHADVMVPALKQLADEKQVALYQALYGGCIPLVNAEGLWQNPFAKGCDSYNENMLNWIVRDSRITTVWIAARWPTYAEATGFGRVDGLDWQVWNPRDARTNASVATVALRTGLNATVARLLAAGKQVVLFGPVPEQEEEVIRCAVRQHLPLIHAQSCQVSASAVAHRQAGTKMALEAVQRANPNLQLFWPDRVLCHSDRCDSVEGSVQLYRDDDHLTGAGAAIVLKRLGITADTVR